MFVLVPQNGMGTSLLNYVTEPWITSLLRVCAKKTTNMEGVVSRKYHINATFLFSTGEKSFLKYSDDVKRKAIRQFGIANCFDEAQKFASRYGYKSGQAEFDAVMWIRMYTQTCVITQGIKQTWPNFNQFYSRLNKELRCAQFKRNSSGQKLFMKIAEIIDKSLTWLPELRPKNYKKYYRGTNTFHFSNWTFFYDGGFFSTSSKPLEALKFADGEYFQILHLISSFRIKNLSQYRYEYEVLCSKGSLFRTDRVERNVTEIKEEIKKLLPNGTDENPLPKVIMWMTQVPNNYNYPIKDQLKSNQTREFCKP